MEDVSDACYKSIRKEQVIRRTTVVVLEGGETKRRKAKEDGSTWAFRSSDSKGPD